jgi:hypothetical protein
MTRTRRVESRNVLTGLLLLLAAGCSDDGDGSDGPDSAQRVVIDRFNVESGTLYNRPGDPVHPDANEPIPFDTLYLERAFGPDGEIVSYYVFDAQSPTPAPMYVLVDAAGDPIPDQLPIVDLLPDSDGYSDYWRLHEVEVPDDYEANTIRSVAEVEDGGLTAMRTDTIVNRPLVPEGSTAELRLDPSQAVDPVPAWYRDEVAFYFDFGIGERPEETVPVVEQYATYKDNARGAASTPKTEADGEQTHHVFAGLPEGNQPSPLWQVIVYDNTFFDSVHDLASALEATVLDPEQLIMNEPIVGIEE